MDVWPWLVRHAGWLLERFHVKGNKKTAFEDCFGKPYQGEVKKFAKAAAIEISWIGSWRESYFGAIGAKRTNVVLRTDDIAGMAIWQDRSSVSNSDIMAQLRAVASIAVARGAGVILVDGGPMGEPTLLAASASGMKLRGKDCSSASLACLCFRVLPVRCLLMDTCTFVVFLVSKFRMCCSFGSVLF